MPEDNRLKGSVIEEFRKSLVAAYNEEQLGMLLREKLDIDYQAIAQGRDYEARVFYLINDFERKGRISEFLEQAYQGNPDNPTLKDFYWKNKNIFTKSEAEQKKIIEDKRQKKLEEHFKEIHKSLQEGSLVFFIGSGINLSDNDLSKDPDFPPSDQRIAAYLKEFRRRTLDELIGFPCEICPFRVDDRPQKEDMICPVIKKIDEAKLDKPQLIQEQDLAVSKLEIRCQAELLQATDKDIKNTLPESVTSQEINNDDLIRARLIKFYNKYKTYDPNSIQNNLINLFKLIRKKKVNQDEDWSFPLIITTNYDYGLEKAFEKNDQEINVMYYSESFVKKEEINKFQLISYKKLSPGRYDQIDLNSIDLKQNDEKFREIFKREQYFYINSGQKGVKFGLPLILKLYGGVLYNAPANQYTFAISKVMPPQNLDQLNGKLKTHLNNCHILFLGYSVTDPGLREILNTLCPDRKEGLNTNNSNSKKRKGWLIHQSIPGKPKDEKYWQRWGVTLDMECSWEEYMEEFKKYFETNKY